VSTSDALRELEARFAAGEMTRAEYSAHRRELLLPDAEPSSDRPDPELPATHLDEPGDPPDPTAAGRYPPPPWASSTGHLTPIPAPSSSAAPTTPGPDASEPDTESDAGTVRERSRPADPDPGVPPAAASAGVAYERLPPAWASSGSDSWLPLADTWVAAEEAEPAPAAPPPPPAAVAQASAAPPPPPAAPPPPPVAAPPPPVAAPPPRVAVPPAAAGPAPDELPVVSEPVPTPAAAPTRDTRGALDFSSRFGPSAAPDAPVGPPPEQAPARSHTGSGGSGVRRAWIAVLALVVLVAAGILVWRLTSGSGNPAASATSAGAPAPVSPSPSVGSTRSASPTPSAPIRADAQHPFGILPSTALSAAGSGPASLAQATARNVIYPEEVTRLSACGATSGSTEVIVGQGWSLSGTVFACRDATSAKAVVGRLAAFEQALHFTPVTLKNAGVKSFFSTLNPPTPGYPAQFHIRYTSGAHVIGLVIQAKSERIGRQAANEVVAGAATFYPPTP
jgi:hypothetical protein